MFGRYSRALRIVEIPRPRPCKAQFEEPRSLLGRSFSRENRSFLRSPKEKNQKKGRPAPGPACGGMPSVDGRARRGLRTRPASGAQTGNPLGSAPTRPPRLRCEGGKPNSHSDTDRGCHKHVLIETAASESGPGSALIRHPAVFLPHWIPDLAPLVWDDGG